jgi:hypothetical protein
VRSDFNPLATFAPAVRTASNGEARVSVKLPDNLQRDIVCRDPYTDQPGTAGQDFGDKPAGWQDNRHRARQEHPDKLLHPWISPADAREHIKVCDCNGDWHADRPFFRLVYFCNRLIRQGIGTQAIDRVGGIYNQAIVA